MQGVRPAVPFRSLSKADDVHNYNIYIIIIIMQGVLPAVPFRSLSKADDVAAGFLEGVMNLPVDGRWLVPFII